MDPHATAGPETFLDAAAEIGRRLVERALWEGDACTWQVMAPDRENPASRVAKPAVAGGTLYEGSSGIALFLGELYGATGDESFARAAVGGIRHALAEGGRLPDHSYGYHSGRTGIAYAAARVGEITGTPELAAQAEDVLRPLAGNEQRDMGVDVIAGGGGAIPALLQLARWVDPELATGMARALADNLIDTATRSAEGWSWSTMRNSSVRNLNGYAHGAAGVGHGFLELYAATGDGRYRYAAEQSFLYERHFFSEEAGNWPDLRHTELGEYQYEGRMEELRARLQGGDALPAQPMRYMTAWCHGAPGIGLSRIRAWELLGGAAYEAEARASFRAVAGSLGEENMGNYSLCHGRFGNAETLLYGARAFGDDRILEPARASAAAGVGKHAGEGAAPWPCGTMGAVSDPGLLLGEAGIGLFLLRLARPETPSALFLTAPDAAAMDGGRAGAEGYAAEARRTAEQHFHRTMRLFAALGVDAQAAIPPAEMGPVPVRSDVEAAYEALRARVAGEGDPALRERLEDAFALDRAQYELARSVEDYTAEFLDLLGRVPAERLDWSDRVAELSPRARVVSTRWDWEAWLEAGGGAPPQEEGDVFWLVQFSNGAANVRRLSAFAALVLQSAQEPAGVGEVVDAVAEAVSGGADVDRAWLEERVRAQLDQAYRAGFVNQGRGVPAAAA